MTPEAREAGGSWRSDLRTLRHLVFPGRAPAGASHGEKLDAFYRPQAEAYDAFRERLLQGRRELYAKLPAPAGGTWIEMGGGTGRNLENLGDRIGGLSQVHLVDITPALLEVARARVERLGWTNVTPTEADATTWTPPGGDCTADVVTFSYSLTMIPDWRAALARAHALLKPGGVIGVVDFYVSEAVPAAGLRRHGAITRAFWPRWFARDGVNPNPDHLPTLRGMFEQMSLDERMASIPYLPGLRTPYYGFIGRKA